MDYVIGTKVVHPCYGAGVIVRIQEKSIGDEAHSYYIIESVARSMQVMVPVGRAESIGLRKVGEEERLRSLLARCSIEPEEHEIEKDFRARTADIRERLKSGRFGEIVNCARALYLLNTRRPLGTTDRQLFDQAKDFLAGELSLATETQVSEAMEQVENLFEAMLAVDEPTEA